MIADSPDNDAFQAINAKRSRPWQGEEEVRLAWVSALENATGLHLNAERAKKDCCYNNVIIEFKAPGFFKGSTSSPKFIEATQGRLLPYILRESEKTGIPPADFIGIAIDGEHLCFAQVIDNCLQTQHLIPFSPFAVTLVIAAITANVRKPVTADYLLADFGHGARRAQVLMQALSDALCEEMRAANSGKVTMLFEEWRTLYGQVADMSLSQAEAIDRELSFSWQGDRKLSLPARLFVVHTYNALLMKLLAADIVAAHGLTSITQPAQAMAALLDDGHLLHVLENNIEKSGIFRQAGIHGFVEEAIFSWYLDVATKPATGTLLIESLRDILATLSLYRTDHLTHSRDVLRDVYQGLVPGKLRQSLGEYYTPDWLVDFTLSKLGDGPWLERRVLDPTCGSGAFLLGAIRAIKLEAQAAGWTEAQTVCHLCTSVWGFDLNPLAVQTARVNFLMEIAPLLKAAPTLSIEIPVLLADAIYSPAPQPNTIDDIVNYKIGSQVAKLDIDLPTVLALDRVRLDQVFAQMGQDVEHEREFHEVGTRLIASALVTAAELATWKHPLQKTYDQILALHRQQWNGIWFRIIRNFFWSATAGQFDCIVGNPPWVRWSKLPEAYRQRVKPTCEKYGIFSKNKRHGGNELDISAMITYTTADKWLKESGRLAFVITGTLFKNPSSAGFRTFQIEPGNTRSQHLSPVSVDDMKALKPFEDASNHTVVAVFDKTDTPGTYPIPYFEWTPKQSSQRAIPSSLSLPEILNRITVTPMAAIPVAETGSPWSVLSPGRYETLQKLSGQCPWVSGRKGITTDLNSVYFVPILNAQETMVQVQSRPDAGRKNIGPPRTAWVEPHLLYPLIKGAGDFEACYLRLSNPDTPPLQLFTFVPNTGITANDYAACEHMMNHPNLSRTRAWFEPYHLLLQERSTYRRQMVGAPYYAVYNVGHYTFQPWKVIWPEMSSKFYAAVAGGADVPLVGTRPYVPDHKVYFASFDHKEPAYFLCGLLNAPPVGEWIESHLVAIQMGNIFKHLTLPEYNPDDAQHVALSQLAETAHHTHDTRQRGTLLADLRDRAERVLYTHTHPLCTP
jgi:hypothetical protein